MRLDSLTHKEIPADTILKEIGVPKDEREVILEFLPLIPVALWAGGAAWTAYDTYQAKKQLDAGEITQAQFAARVGTDVALGVAGGVLGKVAGKGFKVGKEIYKSKKAARAAQKKTANIPTPKDAAVPPTGINVVANATTTTAKTSTKKAVQTAKPGDTIKTAKGEFLAGVDGKATTTRVSAPNAAEIKKQILSVVNKPKSELSTIVTKTEVVPGANAAAKVADKVVDKVKDVAPELAKKVVNKAKDTGTKTVDKVKDVAPKVVNKVKDGGAKVVDKVKDLAKKSAPVSKDISAPAASLSTKTAAKQTTKKLTKTQQDALTKMPEPKVKTKVNKKLVNNPPKKQLTKKQRDALSNMGTPVSSLTNKTVKKQLTKKQRDALSNMGTPISVAVSKGAGKKLTKTQRDALSGTGKYKAKAPNSKLAPTSSAGVKAAGRQVDDIKLKGKTTGKTPGKTPGKTTGKTASRTSRLLRALRGRNGGDYYDTDLTGVIKRHMRNG